jgi:TonB family protein
MIPDAPHLAETPDPAKEPHLADTPDPSKEPHLAEASDSAEEPHLGEAPDAAKEPHLAEAPDSAEEPHWGEAPDAAEDMAPTPLLVEPAVITRAPPEKRFDWNRDAGILAAAFLHAAVLLMFIAQARIQQRPAEPPAIPVELVSLPPPPPPQPQAAQQPTAQSKAQPFRQSGGELDRPAGSLPDQEAPKKDEPAAAQPTEEKAEPVETAKLPPPPQPPAPATSSTAPAAQPETKSSSPTSNAQRPKPLKSSQAPARTAALSPNRPPSESKSENEWLGEGGGDKYLNALRDEILRHRNYPAEIKSIGLDGTAQYEILVDRQGKLLRLRLLHSSGVDVLDHAGLVMIQRTAPFEPLPSYMTGDVVQLVVTLHMAP